MKNISELVLEAITKPQGKDYGNEPSQAEKIFADAVQDMCEGPWMEENYAERLRFIAGYLQDAARLDENQIFNRLLEAKG